MKNVIISVKSKQNSGNHSDDTIELVTSGYYCSSDGKTTVSYMESELTGLEGTKTTFEIEPNTVTLTRSGTVNSQMVFEEGKHYFFLYDTPFGSTTMGVRTKSLRALFGEHGGNMDICYTVDLENVFLGNNSFHINVREASAVEAADAQ